MLKTEIVNFIHKKSKVTRRTISQEFNVCGAVASKELKNLIKEHIVVENGFSESTGGRRSALLILNPEYSRGMGIEISRQGINSVVMKFSGEVVSENPVKYHGAFIESGSAEKGLRNIIDYIDKLLQSTERISGIGIAISGIVDKGRGISKTFPDFPVWEEIHLKDEIEKRFGISVSVESLIHAAVRGEYYYGMGKEFEHLLYIHLGRGISCGAVFGGEVYYGPSGNGGELGHTVVVPDGSLCYCGRNGCLESVASPAYIERQVREAVAEGVHTRSSEKGKITIASIIAAAEKGDNLARNVIEKAGVHIGNAAANLYNIFAPEAVIIGGEFIDEKSLFFLSIRHSFKSNIMGLNDDGSIYPGKLKNKAALVGAGDLSFSPIIC